MWYNGGMKHSGILVAAALFLATGAAAEVFTIERNDPRPFRIHNGPDETPATRAMMRELAAEVKRVTGVQVEVLGYAPAFAGDFFVAIGNAALRESFQNRLERAGKPVGSLIHPSSVIGRETVIGSGTVIMAGAVINPGAALGRGCIVNTCASVDHDCRIGDFVHVSVGARVAGTVMVGARTWIGVGAVVKNNIEIAADCMIGAGTTVVRPITEAGTYVGTPARKIK